jgi:Tfp pilus assembly protein PilV
MIEVLIAMLVVAIGVLALAPMMVLSITGTQFSNDVTVLASAAQRSIESQISKGTFTAMPYVETQVSDNGRYTITTEVLDNTVDASVPGRVYEINVTVAWVDDADLKRSMMFTTYGTKK